MRSTIGFHSMRSMQLWNGLQLDPHHIGLLPLYFVPHTVRFSLADQHSSHENRAKVVRMRIGGLAKYPEIRSRYRATQVM